MKKCSQCGTTKDDAEFYPDRRKKTGLASRCKTCGGIYAAQWRAKNPHKSKERYWQNRDAERERHLVRKYGITFTDYRKMLSDQSEKCAVCGKPEPKHRFFDVDHCHKTGVVRGLLCTSCNRMIGHSGDNPRVLVSAANYLQSSRKQRQSSSKRIERPNHD